MSSDFIVELRNVSLSLGDGQVPILYNLNLTIARGEIVGVVGESGSGKSMTARTIIASLPPGALVEGDVLLGGEAIYRLTPRRLRQIRAQTVGVIFQDPRSAVDPLWTVQDHVMEGMRVHRGISREAALARAVELLRRVGIGDGRRRLAQYPHQMSGGMLQRVVIAGALAGDPALIIADEPTTALDVTTQAEIIAIFAELRRGRELAMLFITHDLGLATALCDRVAVMYAGRIVEIQSSAAIFSRPMHPYTRALVAARPSIHNKRAELAVIPGLPTSAADAPGGCPFRPRCAYALDDCRAADMRLRAVDGALTACGRIQDIREQLHARADDAA